MTKVPQGFDFSFLNEEEARKILRVLERNEELQRAEKDRISKLQKTKRDIRWLQGVTGEWFEEIQRKKFCNETDVSQMLKPPLTYRLWKEMGKNDPMELHTSKSKNLANQKPSASSRASFRSSLASLFSFRRSAKETCRVQAQRQKGCDSRVGSPASVRATSAQAKVYNSPVGNQPVASVFVPKPAIMREESGIPPPWDTSLLENEFFQVLDDLDSKLAEEQSASSMNTRTSFDYGSRTQFNHAYSSANRHGNTIGRHKNYYSETSNMSIYDILRPGTPREGFKTFSPRTRTIYEMYRAREPRFVQEDFMPKNTFGSTSLCFESRQRSASSATGHFTARSLHFPTVTQNKSSFMSPSHQQSPKRTPLSSIIWNRSDSFRERQNQEEFLGASLPMDVDPADQYMHPRRLQERKSYDLYHSQGAYRSVPLNAPMDDAMSPDTLENSENVPFYHQDNPFARSFFSKTVRSTEQRFAQSSFWSRQEEHSWTDFRQSRRPFTCERDFEMISVEAQRSPSVQGPSVASPHQGQFSPGYRAYVFRGREEPHHWRSDFQTSPPDSMETSHLHEHQSSAHVDSLDARSLSGSGCQAQSAVLAHGQDRSPGELCVNLGPRSFGNAQTASSLQTSLPPTPDNRGNPPSSSLYKPTDTLRQIIPDKPESLLMRSMEVTVTQKYSSDSPSAAESQTNIPVTEMNIEKDMTESISADIQVRKMDHTNKMGERPQPASWTAISQGLPDFKNPQDSAQNNTFGFNESATICPRRSAKVFPRKENSLRHVSQRDRVNEPKEEEGFSGNRQLDSATSPLFFLERTLPRAPSPNEGCRQESTASNKASRSIVEDHHWRSEPTDNQTAPSPEELAILDTEGEQYSPIHPTSCSRLAAEHSIPDDSGEQPSNNSCPDALVVPPSTAFSGRSPSDKDRSPGEKEEKVSENKNKNQFVVNASEKSESEGSPVSGHDEAIDAGQGLPYSPSRNGKGKGRVRRRVSYIEKLTRTESRPTPTSEGSDHSTDSGFSTIYCTLPRKSTSFLTNSRQSESKITVASIRNGPLPFQIKNKVDALSRRSPANTLSLRSAESASDCSQVASDSVMGTPEAPKKITNTKVIRAASVRKGPLPFFTKRALSCPLGERSASTEERENSFALNPDVSAITLRTWGRSDSTVREGPLSKRHPPEEFAEERTKKDGETTATRVGSSSPACGDPQLNCADTSRKESRKALHRFKTTSMVSVSGDDENVKCLEVVSVYYTLPRKPSKKFCNLLQRYAQNADSLRESFQGETGPVSNALEGTGCNRSTQEQSGMSPPAEVKVLGSSAQGGLSHATVNMADSLLPNRRPSEPTSEEMASVGADISLPKEEPKTRGISPDDSAKMLRRQRWERQASEILYTSFMLRNKDAAQEKAGNCQPPAAGGDGRPSALPAQPEDNAKDSQAGKDPGDCAGDTAVPTTARGRRPRRAHTAVTVEDSSRVPQPGDARGPVGTDQACALTLALHKLQLADEPHSAEANSQTLQSEPQEVPPQGSQVVEAKGLRKVEEEKQTLVWGHTLPPGGNNKDKSHLGDLEQKESRYSVKDRVAALSKTRRKNPAKDARSPRRHVASVFPQSESKAGFRHGSLVRQRNALSSEPSSSSTESAPESSPTDDREDEEKSQKPIQFAALSNREPSSHSCQEKSVSISQLHQNELSHVSESPPEQKNSKDVTAAQNMTKESGIPVPLTFTSLGGKRFSGHGWRLSPLSSQEPAQKSTRNILLDSHQQPRTRALSLEWEPGPPLYRSKSLKNVNVHGDGLCTSPSPRVRGRHFSESTSVDDALSQLTLGDDFSDHGGCSRRFRSFSEFPSADGNDSWSLNIERAKRGPKSTSSIARPIDYGIFGKEQQLAFLENVKRSLTQGRLWKPSFLKNPGFLKDDVLNPSRCPGSQAPEDGSLPSESLDIYEEDPGDSDCDTDTTTDDEYYLGEHDKESEL